MAGSGGSSILILLVALLIDTPTPSSEFLTPTSPLPSLPFGVCLLDDSLMTGLSRDSPESFDLHFLGDQPPRSPVSPVYLLAVCTSFENCPIHLHIYRLDFLVFDFLLSFLYILLNPLLEYS